MDVTIGLQNVARELVVETDQTSEQVTKDVLDALESGRPVQLTDNRGRTVVVPAAVVGYVEVGGEERRVGVHNIV